MNKYNYFHVVVTRHRGEWKDILVTKSARHARICLDTYKDTYPDHFYKVIERRETAESALAVEAGLETVTKGSLGKAIIRIAKEALGP